MVVVDRNTYDAYFYEDTASQSAIAAKRIVPEILDLGSISSVLDVGCGSGIWLATFADNGVEDYCGLDYDVGSDQLLIPPNRFQRRNLERPFDLDRRFDLVTCLEVAEHLPATSASDLVTSISRHSDLVLFSAAVPGQGGDHHVNEQWPSYWRKYFEAHDFELFDILRGRIWWWSDVTYYFRQNLLLYARNDAAQQLRLLGDAKPVDIVHPDLLGQPPTLRGMSKHLVPALKAAAKSEYARFSHRIRQRRQAS